MDQPVITPEEIRATITISLLKDGRFLCSFPQDALLAYGMLEGARDQVQEHERRKQQEAHRRVAIASTLPPRNGDR
jgi:hypothetical protein